MSDPGARLPLSSLGGGMGFRADTRFVRGEGELQPVQAPVQEPEAEPQDPLMTAYAEGFAAGAAQVRAQVAEQAQKDAAAREGLALAFSRLDRDLEEELRQRLRDTVAALCEAAIAPLALDEDALLRRIEKAVSMLARADDDRLIRLHPDDLILIAPRLQAEWEVMADPTLDRGALRIESGSGGVEDGPAHWRRAIAEALHQC